MGKIDKEKLLKEFKKHGYRTSVIGIINNFPEDPEIDFDFDKAYMEYLKECKKTGCIDCKYSGEHGNNDKCFSNFLKSKNLTAQKQFEIPVKKTWKVKPEIVDMFTRFKISIEDYVKLELRHEPDNFIKQYYDMHEEPDYSKVPVGAVVEIISLKTGIKYYCEIEKESDSSHVFIFDPFTKSVRDFKFSEIKSLEILKMPE